MRRIACWAVLGALGAGPVAGPAGALAEETEKAEKKRPGNMVTLSDFGAEDLGYLALPQQAPLGGVVLVHDQWGLDGHVMNLADALAARGFIAVAVDVYNGRKLTDPAQAAAAANELRIDPAVRTIRAGARLLKTSPKLRVPYVAVVGYGMGAPLALRAASDEKEELIDALVMVEGPLENNRDVIGRLRVPTLALYAEQRAALPPHTAGDFEKLMREEDRTLQMRYVAAKESFPDPRSANYNRKAAQAAWKEVTLFLEQQLNKPPPQPGVLEKIGETLDKGVESVKRILP